MSIIDEGVSFSLEVNVERAYTDLRRLETVLYRTLGLARRMGLSENMDKSIRDIQRMIAFLNSLRLAYIALQAARMAAGDPLAWGMAAVSVGGVIASVVGDISYELGSH